MDFIKKSITSKILLLLLAVTIAAVGIVGVVSYSLGRTVLEQDSYKKLTAVREMKADQIEDYFENINNQIVTLSQSRMTIEAIKSFKKAFNNIPIEKNLSIKEIDQITIQNKNYFKNEFLSRLKNNIDDAAYWESDIPTVVLQNLYITSNENDIGSKDQLNDADDGSSYSRTHKIYHPIIRDYLNKFQYYDIFFVDQETGHIIYSVFKEIDFGTNLIDGPFSNSSIGKAFQASRSQNNSQFTKLVDYESYLPSYNAPAGFISSPIIDNGTILGVLIFQLPIDVINDIMTSKNNWKDVGLGSTGETYIVGEDYLLRNQSRFLIEDKAEYLNSLREINLPTEVISRIEKFNTSIGLQPVKTIGVESALNGLSGTEIFADYRGVSVLSSYKPLNIKDVDWVIMSEMDEDEAFAAVYTLRGKLIVWIGLIFIIIVVSGIIFSRSITRPIKKLALDAEEISKGNLDLEISVDCNDEICKLASNFDSMRSSIKKLIGDLEESNSELEEKVKERTIELEQASEQIRTMVEVAPDGIIMIDTDQKVIIFNPACESTFGYKKEEIIGNSMTMLLPDKSKSVHQAEINKFRDEKGKSRMLDTRREIAGRRKDGTIFPAEAGIAKMKINDEYFYIAFVRDITERKELEERIFKSEERLKFALEGSNDGLWDLMINEKATYFSPRYQTMLGYDAGELEQSSDVWEKLVHPEDKERVLNILEEHIQGKTDSYESEYRMKSKSGDWLWILGRGRVVKRDDDGNAARIVGTHVDVTERKELERQLEKVNERMAGELNVGRDIQMSMIPLIFPAFPDKHELGLYATLIPAREVGGDFYDFYFIDDDHFAFVIGDVSDKGVPAALFMAVSKTLIKSRSSEDKSPASILSYVNNEMSQDNKTNMFVTVFMGILNVKTGEMIFTNAGHNPPYLKKVTGKIEELESRHGMAVGVFGDINYKEAKIKLDPGDIIVMYTDGVTEAMNPDNDQYTEKRLVDLLENSKYNQAEEIVNELYKEVKAFVGKAEQSDDITILSLKFIMKKIEPGAERLKIILNNELPEIERLVISFREFGKKNSFSRELINKINIVIDELLNNAISYAFNDDQSHEIVVDFSISHGRFSMIIEDDGIPFNPFSVESPDTTLSLEERELGGLGIHLIKNLMDDYNYNRKGDKNIITLIKNL